MAGDLRRSSGGAGGYVGRFAPSPTGPLHAGSLVAALASWLDARAHRGRWLVRIEDVDTPRCVPGADRRILQQLAACGLVPDLPPVWQSARGDAYGQALDALLADGHAYPCACSRRDIEDAQAARGIQRQRNAALPYPGTCRQGLHGRTARAWRLRTDLDAVCDEKSPPAQALRAHEAINSAAYAGCVPILWNDRALGLQQQCVETEVGDFVLRRADGLWAYQLAVVVDDGWQGVTDVVRGADLLDNTPRQILLQQALGLQRPRYLHTPLVLGAHGEKLSKQNGATPFDAAQPAEALRAAARVLQLPDGPAGASPPSLLAGWIPGWHARWVDSGPAREPPSYNPPP